MAKSPGVSQGTSMNYDLVVLGDTCAFFFFLKKHARPVDLRKCGIRLDPQMVTDPTACKAAGILTLSVPQITLRLA